MDEATKTALIERCDKLMFVTLTPEHFEAASSNLGGWTGEQLKLLGVEWPPPKGWKARLIGARVPGSVVAAFIRLCRA